MVKTALDKSNAAMNPGPYFLNLYFYSLEP